MHPLIQASKFIEQHMEVFDTRQSQCECCGMIKYENFREAQSHKELGALAKNSVIVIPCRTQIPFDEDRGWSVYRFDFRDHC